MKETALKRSLTIAAAVAAGVAVNPMAHAAPASPPPGK